MHGRLSGSSSWKVLPTPRYVDYGFSGSFIDLKNVAIVRQEGGPYQTVRDKNTELVGQSTITEEELTQILKESGVSNVTSLPDNLQSYDGYDTLILLGNPDRNLLTKKYFAAMKLSFAKWDDPNTPEHDFNSWNDFGREGYLLKVGKSEGKNIIILAGYDYDDAKQSFYGAGTFYAMESLRQMIVMGGSKVKVKTTEIADKPLLTQRACYAGMHGRTGQQAGRCLDAEDQVKLQLLLVVRTGNYPAEAASRCRYPWTPQMLESFKWIGKYSRERFMTVGICLNPDSYPASWCSPMSLDGKTCDPMHYDPNYQVQPEYKEMWAKVGYNVSNDFDIVAAKFCQINKVLGECGILVLMNEDAGYGL